ncbi:Pkinase-fungal domain-containing protein [Mycena chlorophos]|uniref:Pkinase-fungal domain-containing protein n=1 Tax=Mycena chlorophos TaxID=658473 RepID=A0A8H6WB80_MYCCL|nr:Pkinase-fungal domain-containing protein [Mycena chlorophos]
MTESVSCDSRMGQAFAELGAGLWEFSVERFIEMVSPKAKKYTHQSATNAPHEDIDCRENYTFLCNTASFDSRVQTATAMLEETFDPQTLQTPCQRIEHCSALVHFLNMCLEPMRDTVDSSVYAQLRFSLLEDRDWPQPEVIGLPANDAHSKSAIGLPIAVEQDWLAVLLRAKGHAQHLFAVSPLRTSALVGGYNFNSHEFRFLLFHRGGISSSCALDIRRPSGRSGVVRVLMTLHSCRTLQDLGLPGWFDGTTFRLPADAATASPVIEARVEDILSAAGRCRGRGTVVYEISYLQPTPPFPPHNSATEPAQSSKVSRDSSPERISAVLKATWPRDDASHSSIEGEVLRQCSGLFGCLRHHHSFEPALSDDGHLPTTNHLFLPGPGEQSASFHWPLFDSIPPQPEYRRLMLHVSSPVGSSLVLWDHPQDLFRSILHGMLGWLGMFQRGIMHRDPSIGNIIRVSPPVEMAPFVLDATFVVRRSLEDLQASLNDKKINQLIDDLDHERESQRLRSLLAELNVGTSVSGVIIDADCAVRWDEFDKPRNATRVGTAEFMSSDLRNSATKPEYLHSPLDDLAAFYYTAQWTPFQRPVDRQLVPGTTQRHVQVAQEDWHDILRAVFLTHAYQGVADFMEVLRDWEKEFARGGSEDKEWS